MKSKFAEENCKAITSLPLRGAWIEINGIMKSNYTINVAPLAGGVD